MSSVPPDISVVVPTRGRPESLARCLAALERQAVGEAFEIVVVADGPGDEASLAEVVGRSRRSRLLVVSRRGPGAARNAGVAAARGSLVCFTDDDCEPASGWVSALAGSLRRGAQVTAGVTRNGQPENRFAAASQLSADHFAENARVPFSASNNLASRATLLRDVPFDERYADAAGEDRDWCARIAARGIVLARVPDALVFHDQRLTLSGLLAQQIRYGRSAFRYHSGDRPARPFERAAYYGTLLRRGLKLGPVVGLLVALSQAAVAAGFAFEAARALRGRS